MPSDAIARFYASPAAEHGSSSAAKQNIASNVARAARVCEWFAGALTSQDGAFKLEVHTKAASTQALSKSNPLAGKIPSGVDRRARIQGGGATKTLPAATQEQLSVFGQQIGIDLPALISVLNGPVIAYVRPGHPAAGGDDRRATRKPQSAATAVGGLMARFASGAKAVPTRSTAAR